MHFQWDSLLLESAVLSVLASLASSHLSAFICNLLFRLLLFRLMFGSGVVKVACGDKTWRDLTAMSYHCWTQPLPRRMARFAYSMPSYFLHFLTIGNHVVELAVPLLSLTSPWSAGVVVPLMAYLSLQIGISALGYYGNTLYFLPQLIILLLP